MQVASCVIRESTMTNPQEPQPGSSNQSNTATRRHYNLRLRQPGPTGHEVHKDNIQHRTAEQEQKVAQDAALREIYRENIRYWATGQDPIITEQEQRQRSGPRTCGRARSAPSSATPGWKPTPAKDRRTYRMIFNSESWARPATRICRRRSANASTTRRQ
jgi:hypothetical protein